MNKENKNIAIAALDIGTSQIKIGVYFPPISDKIIILDSYKNELEIKNKVVLSDYVLTQKYADKLFEKLGEFTSKNQVSSLYIGICGHVSSLLEWNMQTGEPISNKFPIWLDSSCKDQIEDFKIFMGKGKDQKLIGSFLPPGTNWLFTKLLKNKEKQNDNTRYLQIGDAVSYDLCGKYHTHSSSQVSIVHQQKNHYVDEILSYLNINTDQLPSINNSELLAVKHEKCLEYGFPEQSSLLPSMADFYASFFGLGLNMNDAFILGNTSEIAGHYNDNLKQETNNFVNVSFNKGQITYGSTNTGGNIINWFFESFLNKKISSQLISDYTKKAAQLSPSETPIFLPYLQGERAPFWDTELKASFLDLQLSHTDVHIFRAILESVAFARKQCFEGLNKTDLKVIKMGGGTSQNSLWNSIRSTILNCPLSVTEEKELAITGVINNIIDLLPQEQIIFKPELNYKTFKPNNKLLDTYNEKYKQFINYQSITKQF